jgi:superfamily II DNA/RNA helicase
MEALARKILKKPIEVQIGGRSVVSNTIDQNVMVLDENMKFMKLLELLGQHQAKGSVLVFVDKQKKCDILLKVRVYLLLTRVIFCGVEDGEPHQSSFFSLCVLNS